MRIVTFVTTASNYSVAQSHSSQHHEPGECSLVTGGQTFVALHGSLLTDGLQ